MLRCCKEIFQKLKGLKNKKRLYERQDKKGKGATEISRRLKRRNEVVGKLTGKQNSFLFPCTWFYAAVRRAGQARLPLIYS